MSNFGGFSAKRLFGISRVKLNIGKSVGIPWSRSGRQRKIGGLCCGCLIPIILLIATGLAFAISYYH